MCCRAFQVESLSADVCGLREAQGKLQSQLQGVAGGQQLQEQLKEVMQNTDKRHTRVETAIYQVRQAAPVQWGFLSTVRA